MKMFSAALILPLLAGCSAYNFESTRIEQQSIPATDVSSLAVSTFNGSITVKTHDQPVIDLEVRMRAYGETQEQATANCEALEFRIDQEQAGRVEVVALKPPVQWSPAMSMTLSVPANCNLKLDTSNGEISVADIVGTVEADTSNGGVSCAGVNGSIDAKTSNGQIEVKHCIGSVNLNTSNGRVSYEGQPVGEKNVIDTSNGSVTVKLPRSDYVRVKASTSNGSIRCELPKKEVTIDEKRSIDAIVGEGPEGQALADLFIDTSNGSVSIEASEEVAAQPETQPLPTENAGSPTDQ